MKKSWCIFITIVNLLLLVFLLWCFYKKPNVQFTGNNITTLLGLFVSCISLVITGFFVVFAIDAYGKIREIDEAKRNADRLFQEVSSAEKIIIEAKQDAGEFSNVVSSVERDFQNRKNEIDNLYKQIDGQFELNRERLSNISREMCEILIAFTESAITHAEKEKNNKLRNKSLVKLYRLSYKYPDLLDDKTRESYMLNLSEFGDKSDLKQLEIICQSEKSQRVKEAEKQVIDALKEKYP